MADLLAELMAEAERQARRDVPLADPIVGYAIVVGADGRRTLLAMPDLTGRQRAWTLRLVATQEHATHLVHWTEVWGAVITPTNRDDPVVRRFLSGEIEGVRDLPPDYRRDAVVIYAEAEGRVRRQRHFDIEGFMPERRMALLADAATERPGGGDVFYPLLPANMLAERVVGPLRPPTRRGI